MDSTLHLVGLWELNSLTVFAFRSASGVCLGAKVGTGKKWFASLWRLFLISQLWLCYCQIELCFLTTALYWVLLCCPPSYFLVFELGGSARQGFGFASSQTQLMRWGKGYLLLLIHRNGISRWVTGEITQHFIPGIDYAGCLTQLTLGFLWPLSWWVGYRQGSKYWKPSSVFKALLLVLTHILPLPPHLWRKQWKWIKEMEPEREETALSLRSLPTFIQCLLYDRHCPVLWNQYLSN